MTDRMGGGMVVAGVHHRPVDGDRMLRPALVGATNQPARARRRPRPHGGGELRPGAGPVPQRRPPSTALAAGIGLLAAVLLALGVWARQNDPAGEHSLAETLVLLGAFQAYLAAGLVLVARRPANRLGWLLTAVGLLNDAGFLANEYAELALAAGGRQLPAGVFAAWVAQWWWWPAIVAVLVFVPLFFPTGAPPSPRWRWLPLLAGAALALLTVLAALNPELVSQEGRYRLANPIGVAAVGDVEQSTLGGVLFAVLAFCMVSTIASLVVRFRRARGVERQQLKWFVYSGALAIGLALLDLGLAPYLPGSDVVFGLVIGLPPLAIGIAVLRYRLYAIDRIISRTLAYAALTAVLAGVYLVAVTVLTAVTAPVTGDAPVAVAAATLAAAALFRPARRRIQTAVDRRFDRARYDAARTVDAYRLGLRDELDLDALVPQLIDVIRTTVAPARLSVWLRSPEGSR